MIAEHIRRCAMRPEMLCGEVYWYWWFRNSELSTSRICEMRTSVTPQINQSTRTACRGVGLVSLRFRPFIFDHFWRHVSKTSSIFVWTGWFEDWWNRCRWRERQNTQSGSGFSRSVTSDVLSRKTSKQSLSLLRKGSRLPLVETFPARSATVALLTHFLSARDLCFLDFAVSLVAAFLSR